MARHDLTAEVIRARLKRPLLSLMALLVFSGVGTSAQGHWVASVPLQETDWQTDQISRVVAGGDGHLVGLDGKRCLEGAEFLFDVNDRYAFDIDETVELQVEFYRHAKAAAVEVNYENNGEAEGKVRAQIPAYDGIERTYKTTFSLERARFANRELWLTDFSIAGAPGFAICSVSLKRSYATVVPKAFGNIALEIADEKGRLVPARVGIYDPTGRLPLPSDEAIAVKRLDDTVRVVSPTPGLIPWPARNPSVFYVNGAYHAKLPVGPYELVVGKGPEYRFIRRRFTVEADRTQTLQVQLKRWDDVPATGWYSGDNHIHYIRRDQNDDPNLLLFTQAEDLHVANILQAGNIATTTWPDYGWSPVSAITDDTYSFVPGQEDPRTARRGHAIGLHLTEPIRDPQHYLLYHRAFERVRAQGGVVGYAHALGQTSLNARGGLALDVPFGLVDFVEVMQFGYAGSRLWFDFLNLGYKLAPSAGTDYGWDVTLPGAERSYVYVAKPFSLQRWFDGLKRGATFVTNGPLLQLTVNGQGMGSELRLKSGQKLTIHATASINPDIDSLRSLELIEQGTVIKTIKARGPGELTLQLDHQMTARHGTWLAIRARGSTQRAATELPSPYSEWADNDGSARVALSGPVYVYVDGQSFWKPAAVPGIVQRLKPGLERLLAPETGEGEDWGTRETSLLLWDAQKGDLQQRVDQVMRIYGDLVDRAKAALQ